MTDLFLPAVERIERFGRGISSTADKVAIALTELDQDVPLRTRLRAYRHGHTVESYVWLDLDARDPEQYYYWDGVDHFRIVNGDYVRILENKLAFHLLSDEADISIPELYGTVKNGRFLARIEGTSTLSEVVDRHGNAVFKPISGNKGEGIFVVEGSKDGYSIDGNVRSEAVLDEVVSGLDNYLVTEYVEQHRYAEAVFPDATNTIRILTITDKDTSRAKVARATHRFGTEESKPLDNRSEGGICAPVDIEDGTLKDIVTVDEGSERRRGVTHPETGSQVSGLSIPHWDAVVELMEAAALQHAEAPMIGWDVIVTDDGPVVIEANPLPGKIYIQIEEGLYEDDFFRELVDKYSSTA